VGATTSVLLLLLLLGDPPVELLLLLLLSVSLGADATLASFDSCQKDKEGLVLMCELEN